MLVLELQRILKHLLLVQLLLPLLLVLAQVLEQTPVQGQGKVLMRSWLGCCFAVDNAVDNGVRVGTGDLCAQSRSAHHSCAPAQH